MRPIFAALALCAPFAANAQDAGTFALDLNGDGRVERFTILPNEDTVTLQIENTGGGVIYFDDIAVRTEDAPYARLGEVWEYWRPGPSGAATDRIKLSSGPGPDGDDPWEQSLIIGYQDGSYVIIGYEYYRWFPENGDWFVGCDLDFTGRESLYIEYDMIAGLEPIQDPISVADWTAQTPVPTVCSDEFHFPT